MERAAGYGSPFILPLPWELASSVGAEIQIHGTCLVNKTILLYPSRSYLGDSRTGTVIQQTDGANLTALVASQGWWVNSSYADDPVTIAHMTLNGNSQNNSGTNGLVIRSWQTTIEDLQVEYAPADGILTDFRTAASFNHPCVKPFSLWRELRSAQALVVLLARLGSAGNLRRFPCHCRSWNGPHSRPMHLAVLPARDRSSERAGARVEAAE
jgi:hypothetical protein